MTSNDATTTTVLTKAEALNREEMMEWRAQKHPPMYGRFTKEYDPWTGAETAIILGTSLVLVLIYVIYKGKCRGSDENDSEKNYFEYYKRKFDGLPTGPPPKSAVDAARALLLKRSRGKPWFNSALFDGESRFPRGFDDNTARWIYSQPLQSAIPDLFEIRVDEARSCECRNCPNPGVMCSHRARSHSVSHQLGASGRLPAASGSISINFSKPAPVSPDTESDNDSDLGRYNDVPAIRLSEYRSAGDSSLSGYSQGRFSSICDDLDASLVASGNRRESLATNICEEDILLANVFIDEVLTLNKAVPGCETSWSGHALQVSELRSGRETTIRRPSQLQIPSLASKIRPARVPSPEISCDCHEDHKSTPIGQLQVPTTRRNSTTERNSSIGNRNSSNGDRNCSNRDRNSSNDNQNSSNDEQDSTSDEQNSSNEDQNSPNDDQNSCSDDRKSSNDDQNSSNDVQNNSNADQNCSNDDRNSSNDDKNSSHDNQNSANNDKNSSNDGQNSSHDDQHGSNENLYDKRYSSTTKSNPKRGADNDGRGGADDDQQGGFSGDKFGQKLLSGKFRFGLKGRKRKMDVQGKAERSERKPMRDKNFVYTTLSIAQLHKDHSSEKSEKQSETTANNAEESDVCSTLLVSGSSTGEMEKNRLQKHSMQSIFNLSSWPPKKVSIGDQPLLRTPSNHPDQQCREGYDLSAPEDCANWISIKEEQHHRKSSRDLLLHKSKRLVKSKSGNSKIPAKQQPTESSKSAIRIKSTNDVRLSQNINGLPQPSSRNPYKSLPSPSQNTELSTEFLHLQDSTHTHTEPIENSGETDTYKFVNKSTNNKLLTDKSSTATSLSTVCSPFRVVIPQTHPFAFDRAQTASILPKTNSNFAVATTFPNTNSSFAMTTTTLPKSKPCFKATPIHHHPSNSSTISFHPTTPPNPTHYSPTNQDLPNYSLSSTIRCFLPSINPSSQTILAHPHINPSCPTILLNPNTNPSSPTILVNPNTNNSSTIPIYPNTNLSSPTIPVNPNTNSPATNRNLSYPTVAVLPSPDLWYKTTSAVPNTDRTSVNQQANLNLHTNPYSSTTSTYTSYNSSFPTIQVHPNIIPSPLIAAPIPNTTSNSQKTPTLLNTTKHDNMIFSCSKTQDHVNTNPNSAETVINIHPNSPRSTIHTGIIQTIPTNQVSSGIILAKTNFRVPTSLVSSTTMHLYQKGTYSYASNVHCLPLSQAPASNTVPPENYQQSPTLLAPNTFVQTNTQTIGTQELTAAITNTKISSTSTSHNNLVTPTENCCTHSPYAKAQSSGHLSHESKPLSSHSPTYSLRSIPQQVTNSKLRAPMPNSRSDSKSEPFNFSDILIPAKNNLPKGSCSTRTGHPIKNVCLPKAAVTFSNCSTTTSNIPRCSASTDMQQLINPSHIFHQQVSNSSITYFSQPVIFASPLAPAAAVIVDRSSPDETRIQSSVHSPSISGTKDLNTTNPCPSSCSLDPANIKFISSQEMFSTIPAASLHSSCDHTKHTGTTKNSMTEKSLTKDSQEQRDSPST